MAGLLEQQSEEEEEDEGRRRRRVTVAAVKSDRLKRGDPESREGKEAHPVSVFSLVQLTAR